MYESGTQEATTGSSLEQAAAYIRASLRSDGSDACGFSEFDAPEREWNALFQFSKACGLILPAEFIGLVRSETREHEVRFDEATGLWWKFTRPNSAGFTVDWYEDGRPYMLNASPLQYLDRLILQNDVFADQIEFRGICFDIKGAHRIVITQPDIPGRAATAAEIEAKMIEMEFETLPWTGIGYEHSLAFKSAEGITVWDAHPANMVVQDNGTLVPIDVIMVRTTA